MILQGREVILQGRHLFEKRFSSPHPIFQKLLYAIRPGLLSQSGQIAIKFCKGVCGERYLIFQ